MTATTVAGAAPGAIVNDYDDQLRLASQTVGGAEVTYDYDDDGLPVRIGELTLTHDSDNGKFAGLGSGASQTTVSRTALGEPDAVTTRQGAATTYAETYARDDIGRITTRTATRAAGSTTWEYGYDAAGRLETVERDGATVATYTYGANDNRASVTRGAMTVEYGYDAQDRLQSAGATTYTYTPAGELRTKKTGTAETTYDYDATGALTGVELPDGTQLGYTIDAGGRRVAETGGTSQRRFLYGSGLGPVAELDANGVRSRFIYATRSNVPDLMIRGGKTYRIVTDQLGSPVAVIDVETGATVQELDYDEFGRVTRDTQPEFQPFGFAGGLYDPETGLVRFGARDYDPETGRFTTPDPAGFEGGSTNLYGYALADPVNVTDPSGQILDTLLDIGFIGYDLYRIGNSLLNGCGVSGVDAAALGLDIAAAFIPFATGGGAAARKINEGIYQIDTPLGPYVGQASDIDRRMKQWERSKRFTPEEIANAQRTEVLGGKTQREIAEQRRINDLTDGVGASSDKVLNIRNPIGPNRRHLMDD
jgi:RHS repeat-associated protein